MKLFLDTAHLKDIATWHDIGIIDGVTTNPTLLSKEGKDAKKHIKDICALMQGYDVSVEVTQTEQNAVYKQAKEIASIADNVVVKIPCHRNFYAVIDKLTKEGIAINVTLVFTLIQGMVMAKLGVRYISPFIGRWNDIDVDGQLILEEMRHMIDEYQYGTEILAASIRTVRDVHDAILAGADIATLPVSIMEKMTEHPLTDKGIELFLADWQKLGIKQFP